MKPTKLTIKNIGIIADMELAITKPLLVFYGDVMAGKTTILNAIRWVFGGAFPADIIRHGARDAFVQFEGTEDGRPWVIRREWYVAKDETTKARSISFTRNGVPAKKPVDEISRFLNPFLLDQDHLRGMTSLQRGRYLAELFGVDTAAEDLAISESVKRASALRVKIDSYGTIDLTPVKQVDVDALKLERAQIGNKAAAEREAARNDMSLVSQKYEAECASVDALNREARKIHEDACAKVTEERTAADKRTADRVTVQGRMDAAKARRIELNKELAEIETNLAKGDAWLQDHPAIATPSYPQAPQELPRPAMPDTTEINTRMAVQPDTTAIDAKLQEAGAQNVRAEQYLANVERAKARDADNAKLLAEERSQRELKAAKVDKLANIGASEKVTGLVFMENGGFEYEATDSGMLSDSQIMRLSQALSALYPDGFGLSLIDRGESLGRGVMDLVVDAKNRDATILVTVVGDRPAKIPEEVGAFVVENGKVSQ